MPTYLADHVEQNNLQGQLRYTLFVGASSGAETENRWADLDMIERRSPHQVGKNISKGINNGRIKFFDKHLSMFPVDLVYVCQADGCFCKTTLADNGIGILHQGQTEQQARRCLRRGY